MKKIKKVMATLLAATLVLGSTMTAFAAEKTETMTELGTTKSVPIRIGYSAPTDAENNDIVAGIGGENAYNIEISYDNLDFEYKTTSIKWISAKNEYVVTTEADPNPSRAIQVNNKSTSKEISVTPSFISNNPKEGVTYEIELKNSDQNNTVISTVSNTGVTNSSSSDFLGGAWGKNTANYTVNVKTMKFAPEVESFAKAQFAAVSLTFADAPHTGGNGGTN